MHAIPFTPGLSPSTATAAIARQLARRNRRDAEQAAARALGQWCRAQGPRLNRHGLYAPGDAR